MSITVVRVNKPSNFTNYIGRSWAGYEESPFHNPFHVGRDGTREEVLLKFIIYWYSPKQKYLRDYALEVLRDDDILGCWCKPQSCHGDIIAGYVNWKRNVDNL